MAFIKLVIFGFIALSVVYFSVSLYVRSLRREALEEDFDEAHPGGDATARRTFVEEGMAAYSRSLWPKLVLLVYVIPLVAMVTIIVLTN